MATCHESPGASCFSRWPLFFGYTVGRFFISDFADTRDHRKFHARPLDASPRPYHYAVAVQEKGPKVITLKGKDMAFDRYLEEYRTVAFQIIHRDTTA